MKKELTLALLILLPAYSYSITPSERIRNVEKNIEGKTFKAIATMIVVRNDQERRMKMKLWWKDRKLALISILEPKKDQGTGNLRIKTDLWQYLPKVNRIVRVPSSMMLQSWMGSDFTNDDLVKSGSLFSDYTHKEIGKDKIGSDDVIKIECSPKSNSAVVWGKVLVWLREQDDVPMKQEYYSEKGELIKVMEGRNIKKFGNHTIPTQMTMTNLKKNGNKTHIEYEHDSIEFDKDIPDSLFSQENLRKGLN